MAVQAPTVQELHGKWFTQSRAGNMFVAECAAAGVVPPIYNNTAQTFGLWNPQGSGVNAVITKLRVGLVTVGVVTSNFVYSYNTGVTTVATGTGVVTVATQTTPVSTIVGYTAAQPQCKMMTAVTTVAPTFYRSIGLSTCMATTPTAANMFWAQMGEDYDGDLIVPPGVVLYVGNNIAGVATYNLALTFYETPL